MKEPSIKIIDGISVYEEPYKVKTEDWLFEHLDCHGIGDTDLDEMLIYAFVNTKNKSIDIEGFRDKYFPDKNIFFTLGSSEVSCK